MSELEVAVPWNLSNYFAGNGFHSLYQSWFDLGMGANGVRLNILDEPAFVDQLGAEPDWLSGIEAEIVRLEHRLKASWAKFELATDFISWSTLDNLWLTRQLTGQVELHHTCPLTTGFRPFVVHCESFLPTFMPFAFQGKGVMQSPGAVKKFYGALLGNNACLGIFSHLQVTLDQFSQFFGSAKIDDKLCLTPVGLGENVYRCLDSVGREQAPTAPLFLFTGSVHQNPSNLSARGLYTSMLFWEALRSQYPRSRFVLRCARPSEPELKAAGSSWLREDERNGRLLWIEGYLPEAEQLNLFRQADFYLLPSANLHSVSIMQAQLSGAIPIVSDAYGIDRYVRDGNTGVVLQGARQKVWFTDPNTGIPVDEHTLIDRRFMRDQADQMLSRVTALLDAPDALLNLRATTRAHARHAYRGKAFREFVFDRMVSLGGRNGRKSRTPQRTLPVCQSSRIERFFAMPPTPLQLLDTGDLQLCTSRGIYAVCYKINALDERRLSPLYLAKSRVIGSHPDAIAWEMADLGDRLLRNRTLPPPARMTGPPSGGRSWPNHVLSRVLSRKLRRSARKRLATLSKWFED
jgi:hypothetical protein